MIDKEKLYQTALEFRRMRIRVRIAQLRVTAAQAEANRLSQEARQLEQEMMQQKSPDAVTLEDLPTLWSVDRKDDAGQVRNVITELQGHLNDTYEESTKAHLVENPNFHPWVTKLSNPAEELGAALIANEAEGITKDDGFIDTDKAVAAWGSTTE